MAGTRSDTAAVDLRSFCEALAAAASDAFAGPLATREDSRAFGALVERRIVEAWPAICARVAAIADPIPGRRSVFDVSLRSGGNRFGVDVLTTDLDAGRYSDGGVCSVDNLLRLLTGGETTLVLLEVAHRASASHDRREIASLVVAPIHVLPEETIRIENLGTGQVRLDETLAASWPGLDWNRAPAAFLEHFVEKAVVHYRRVITDAEARIANLRDLQSRGYVSFRAARPRNR